MFRTGLLSIIRGLNTVFTAKDIRHTTYVEYLLARTEWVFTAKGISHTS